MGLCVVLYFGVCVPCGSWVYRLMEEDEYDWGPTEGSVGGKIALLVRVVTKRPVHKPTFKMLAQRVWNVVDKVKIEDADVIACCLNLIVKMMLIEC